MKKRFVCAFLALILLVGLVPATALTAEAASLSVSESAITVLKQLEGYSQKCDSNGYTGYGTKCTQKGNHANHLTTETKADQALREELKALDKAINNSGLTLTQSKHDALVLFSFQNGTAWLNGTGSLKSAVSSGKKGTDFLNALCTWNASEADDDRRMIEANMYLYGVYSSTRPSKFIRVRFDASTSIKETVGSWMVVKWQDGYINGEESRTYYYDVTSKPAPHLVPVTENYNFTGWYVGTEFGQLEKVGALTASHHGKTLVAGWAPTSAITDNAVAVNYLVNKSQLLSEYVYAYNPGELKYYTHKDESGKTVTEEYYVPTEKSGFELAQDAKKNKIKASKFFCTDDALWVDRDMLDENGTRWCRIQETQYWVKVSNKTSGASSSDSSIDLTVTVTNDYVNRREKASIYSNKTGSYNSGDKLRIIDTASKDGFLWGMVAKNTTGTESAGWIALMYTDYETVRNQSASSNTNSGTVIATGFITYNGYVNVRSDAGTDNRIVGALPCGTEVKIYQTKFVNGLEWGRTDSGWFCLSYANITRKSNTTNTTDVGFSAYAFTGELAASAVIYQSPDGDPISTFQVISGNVTVSNLVKSGDITWGKISQGWVKVSDANGAPVDVKLDTAKYNVISTLTVRKQPNAAAGRVDTLSKGVEFNVNQDGSQVIVVGDSIWAWAYKVGEGNKTYGGWVNLANKYVTRGNAPTVSVENNQTLTGKVGTIVGADSVRVRGDSTLSGKLLGSIARGTVVNVLDERNGWYKIDYKLSDDESIDSWVYGQYIEVTDGSVGSTTGSNTSTGNTVSTDGTGIGIIANTYGGVNLRATPGTGGTLKGKILPGTQVNILETKTVGSAKWGRVEQGWICMDYVQIISDLPQEVLDALLGTNNTTGTNNGTSSSTTTGAEVAIYTGTVNQQVNVRKTTSLDAEIVRVLEAGANITLHEILEVETVTEYTDDGTGKLVSEKIIGYWARVNDGYIYNPAAHIALDALDESVYTVTGSENLNVRSAAGTGNSIVHKLSKGDQVKVTRLQIVDGNVWGYVEAEATDAKTYIDENGNEVVSDNAWEKAWNGEGWISLAYTTKGAVSLKNNNTNSGSNAPEATTPTETKPVGSLGNTGSTGIVNNASGYKYTGKVINTTSLNVRATASTNAKVTTKLSGGASLVIYETCISESMAWGRCDAGWVYLYYVDMTPVNGAVDARVVYNDNTIAYTDVNCSETAGTYARMAVIDIYEIVGNMVRTDLGWVSTDNLL